MIVGAGTGGYSGDGELATAAQLDRPEGVAVDGAGNLYIADANNHRVRRVAVSSGGGVAPPPPADDHANNRLGATRLPLKASLAGSNETVGDED